MAGETGGSKVNFVETTEGIQDHHPKHGGSILKKEEFGICK